MKAGMIAILGGVVATGTVLMLSACGRAAPVTERVGVAGQRPIATPDELARALPGEPAEVLAAAEGVLARFGLAVAGAAERQPGGGGLVLSEWATVHTTWAGANVSAWLLCGAPSTARVELVSPWLEPAGFKPMDLGPAAAITDAVPVDVRLGVAVQPRVGGSSARLVVEAGGVRPELGPPLTREIGCIPTQALVETVFNLLGGGAAGP